jgi:hypothetical protein
MMVLVSKSLPARLSGEDFENTAELTEWAKSQPEIPLLQLGWLFQSR